MRTLHQICLFGPNLTKIGHFRLIAFEERSQKINSNIQILKYLFPTQCTKCTYFLHNAQSELISYTMHKVNWFPTQCTKCTYFLHNVHSELISYTMHKVNLFPTQCTKWTYFLHNVQSVLISYTTYKVNLFPTQCTKWTYFLRNVQSELISYIKAFIPKSFFCLFSYSILREGIKIPCFRYLCRELLDSW